jgi:L-fuconolactonase
VGPGSEIIDEVTVTAGNVHDAAAVDDLLAGHADDEHKPTVMGDCAYGNADTLAKLADAGYDDVKARVAPARGRDGRYGKDDFDVDLHASTVTCPAGHVVDIRFGKDGSGRAGFDGHCGGCPLRAACTTSTDGRTVTVHPREAVLQAHKAAQADPAWQDAYTGTRPKVERKIAHYVRVAWGGRKARVRGKERVATDVDTRAAAVMLEELLAREHFVGVRNLIHVRPDADWVLSATVDTSLGLLEHAEIPFDLVSVLPRHLEHVAVLCERHPGLRIVIDHLSKPPIGRSDREPWASLLAQAAEFPNVYAKVSGLYPGGDDPRRWSVEDIRPIVHYAVELFGTERLMFGSDWPICEVAGGYGAVVGALFDIFEDFAGPERAALLGGTASSVYGLGVQAP